MNIFARPLFEAVADILPSMRYVVEEILSNKSIWEDKIEEERDHKKKNPDSFLSPSFALDPSPSPFSGGPARPTDVIRGYQASHLGRSVQSASNEDENRRGSTGSIQAISISRRASSGTEKGSRRSSAGFQSARSQENHSQSRRGSGDPSLTAILVTQTAKVPEAAGNGPHLDSGHGSKSQGERKDTLTKSSPNQEKEGHRPVTAPSSARRSQATSLFAAPRAPSQSHSEVDLTHAANGNLEGPKLEQWHTSKVSGDSTVSDGSRDSHRKPGWWRQMGSTRRPRETRNGDHEVPRYQKETSLEPALSHPSSDVGSPDASSPGRTSRTGKLKSFFKRKPRTSTEQDKQLSSYGSSSQLRTPQTSDPGRSLNSDE
jgi:3',5'-cyclic-nucleotide phosphodiesterase